MTDIDATLHAYDYFHDWYIFRIAIQNQLDISCPDTLILSLKLGTRTATVTFQGMTRLGIENGGTVNIVLSLERAQPNTEVESLARNLLKRSLPGKRAAQHIVYLHPTAGFAIAVEFDSMQVLEGAE
ncbi:MULTISPECIES: hypothetical protein [unclassified Paraburkholderia]|uniref:hypothetical protein n=1 Tax=unclassified Paraburkholderia TaxID=2615204 RepID=UPI002AB7B3B0|nr:MULTISPECIES: hypothetical protein [unclassified Paraburkholderia]